MRFKIARGMFYFLLAVGVPLTICAILSLVMGENSSPGIITRKLPNMWMVFMLGAQVVDLSIRLRKLQDGIK